MSEGDAAHAASLPPRERCATTSERAYERGRALQIRHSVRAVRIDTPSGLKWPSAGAGVRLRASRLTRRRGSDAYAKCGNKGRVLDRVASPGTPWAGLAVARDRVRREPLQTRRIGTLSRMTRLRA